MKAGTKFDDIPNFRLFEKAFKSLKVDDVETNIFIDGNHLKLAIDDLVFNAQKLHERMFTKYKLGKCPALQTNEHVYSEFIYTIIRKVEGSLFTAYRDYSSKNYQIDIARESDPLIAAIVEKEKTGKIFSKESDLFEQTVQAKRKGWDKKKPELLNFSNYVNFFVGGELDSQKFLKDLNARLRSSSDRDYQNRLRDYIKAFSGEMHSSFEAKKQQIKEKGYKIFKSALTNFDKRWPELVAQTQKGYVKHQIHERNMHERSKVMVTFREKAVDTKLIIKALDDLNEAKDNTIFALFTNDTDFAPLFEKIMSKCQLLWIYGGDPNHGSSDLKKIVPASNRFNIAELIHGKEFNKFGYQHVQDTNWWTENQLAQFSRHGEQGIQSIYSQFSDALWQEHFEKAYDAYQEQSRKEEEYHYKKHLEKMDFPEDY